MTGEFPQKMVITVTDDHWIRRHIQRLCRTGLWGQSESEVGMKLMLDQLQYLIDTGAISKMEKFNRKTLELVRQNPSSAKTPPPEAE